MSTGFEELQEIEEEVRELEIDLQSNATSILTDPKGHHSKIEEIEKLLNQNEQRLQFFRKSSNNPTPEFFKRISDLEKKITILKNQMDLNIKMLKKEN